MPLYYFVPVNEILTNTVSISVVLPVYNADKTVHNAMMSILTDAAPDTEIIAINNASSDNSADILAKLAQADPRIRIINEPTKGVANALNVGLRAAKGKYIARMDADDISLPGRLNSQKLFLEQNPEIGLVSGIVEYQGKSEGYAEYVKQINAWHTEDQIYRYRFVESPFAHPSVMFRKSLIDQYGYYSTENEPEDYEMWLRWFSHGVRMAKINQPVLQWSDLPERVSRIHESCTPEAFDRVRYRYLGQWIKTNFPTQKPIFVWGGGRLARQKMELLQQYGNFRVTGIFDLKPKHGKTVPHRHFSDIPPAGKICVVSMVSNRGKYLEIESYLTEQGYQNGIDFILGG